MKEKRNYLIVGGAILALLCLLLILLLVTKAKNSEKNEKDPGKTPTKQVVQTQTTYELPGNMSYRYDAETKTVTLLSERFVNSESNERLLQYSVRRKSDGELLYEAEPLQPGDSLESISFVFDAEPGEYELYLISASLDPSTKEEKNSVMTPLTLVIP